MSLVIFLLLVAVVVAVDGMVLTTDVTVTGIIVEAVEIDVENMVVSGLRISVVIENDALVFAVLSEVDISVLDREVKSNWVVAADIVVVQGVRAEAKAWVVEAGVVIAVGSGLVVATLDVAGAEVVTCIVLTAAV